MHTTHVKHDDNSNDAGETANLTFWRCHDFQPPHLSESLGGNAFLIGETQCRSDQQPCFKRGKHLHTLDTPALQTLPDGQWQ